MWLHCTGFRGEARGERTLGKLGPDYELHMTEGFAPIASLSDTDPGFDLGV